MYSCCPRCKSCETCDGSGFIETIYSSGMRQPYLPFDDADTLQIPSKEFHKLMEMEYSAVDPFPAVDECGTTLSSRMKSDDEEDQDNALARDPVLPLLFPGKPKPISVLAVVLILSICIISYLTR